jgi:multiple sugar transport system permease protein
LVRGRAARWHLKNNLLIFNDHPTLANLKLLFDKTLYLHVGLEYRDRRRARRRDHPGAGAAGRLRARPADRQVGRAPGHRDLPHLSGAVDLLFIPMSRIVATLGLQDTLWALVVVYPSFTMPFCVWLLMGFFKSIPKDIEEAAMVDGCSRALTFITSSGQQTVGVGVPTNLVRGDVYFWGSLMAACLIPVAILYNYNLFLDRFISGFTVGAIK